MKYMYIHVIFFNLVGMGCSEGFCIFTNNNFYETGTGY
jgi:hypothetical protein